MTAEIINIAVRWRSQPSAEAMERARACAEHVAHLAATATEEARSGNFVGAAAFLQDAFKGAFAEVVNQSKEEEPANH
jgi:hypothetical protein